MKARALDLIAQKLEHPVHASRVLVVSDVQLPFGDIPVLNLVYEFSSRWKPDLLLVDGDLTDCYSLSDFDKDPSKVSRLQEEISQTADFFSHFPMRKVWLGGNHEDRWRKILWRVQNYGPGVNEMLRALLSAAEVGSDADSAFRYAFGTKKARVEYWPYGHYVTLAENNLIVTHGFKLSSYSAYTARAHLDRLGKSVIIGHTHRQGVYRNSNLRGTHGAWENGCLCRLDPEFVQFPNWQQGFSMVSVEGNQFYVEQIPILPGPSIKYNGWTIR